MPSKDPETLNEKKIPSNTHLPSSWDEAFAAFKNDLYSRGRSESTVVGYAYALHAFALFYCDRLKKPGPFVALLQETDVQAFVNFLRYDRHLSATSVNRHIAALRALSSFLLVKGWHLRTIARDLKTYRIGSSNHLSSLSTEETRRLVTAVNLGGRNGRRDLAIVQIFLHCGLRVSELAGLSRDDAIIHKMIGKIRVRSEKRRLERTISLNSTARRAIEDYLEFRGPTVGREVLAFGDMIRVKTLEDQEEVFWFLTVIQNAIVLWDVLSLEHILDNRPTIISDADLKRMLPTMTEDINFIGRFDLDLQRNPPFELKRVLG